MRTETFWVGDIECRRFIHRQDRGTPTWMFPDVAPEPLARRMGPHLHADGTFDYVYSSLLLRVGPDVALLDTSLPAPVAGRPSSIERFLDAHQIAPSDVGTVVVTHAHLDHIGGLVRSDEPAFGAARHLIARRELAYWTSGDQSGEAAASVLRPLVAAGLVDEVEEEREVLPGVSLVPTPGHTPGHLSVAITSRGERALYVGDVLAHEINVPEPAWNHFSDMLPEEAAASRRRVVEQAAEDGATVIGSHITTRGRVEKAPGGHRYAVES